MKSAYAAVLFALATTVASAQLAPRALQGTPGGAPAPLLKVHHEATDDTSPAKVLMTLPAQSWTITDWYKQTVYDRSDKKIGEVMDVLVDHDGKINAIIVGVGGFLGVGEKDVAVAYDSIWFKKKDNNNWQLVMNTTNEVLAKAPGYKFDRTSRTWMAVNPPASTIGGPPAPTPRPR
jgi:sporulation protein YlmC with PRC-barrel domain